MADECEAKTGGAMYVGEGRKSGGCLVQPRSLNDCTPSRFRGGSGPEVGQTYIRWTVTTLF